MPILSQDSSYPFYWRAFLFYVCKGTHKDQEKLRSTWHSHIFSFYHGYCSGFGVNSGSFRSNISLVSWSEVNLDNNSIFHFFTLRILKQRILTNLHRHLFVTHSQLHSINRISKKDLYPLPSAHSIRDNRVVLLASDSFYQVDFEKWDGEKEVNQ